MDILEFTGTHFEGRDTMEAPFLVVTSGLFEYSFTRCYKEY